MRRRAARTAAAALCALAALASPVAAAELSPGYAPPETRPPSFVERLAERGPGAFAVGLTFTLMAPFQLAWNGVRGEPVAQHACHLGHGVKMLAASAVLLPAGLLLTPFNYERVPDGWLDGVIEAFQEDYCTRPLLAFYP